MFHRPTSYFNKGPWAIANNRFAKRAGTHAFPEGIDNHRLLRSTNFHYLGPKAVDVLF